jgi:uncharacterized protein
MKIAVIGSGISGLSCAWLLSKFSKHHVTLFEQHDTLGGHTNTIDATVDGITYPVDTGFLVFNDWTYPNFIAMLKHLRVEDALSDMSFSVKLTAGAHHRDSCLEWSGSSLATVFAQPTNLFNPTFLRMLREVVRFNREATALVAANAPMHGTVGEYITAHGYSAAFRDWYLAPMAGCIWSTPTQKISAFPLATMLNFCHNHGLLSVNKRPQWRTVKGGARHYVQAMVPAIERIRKGVPVMRVSRHEESISITAGGVNDDFEQVVFACHSDQVLRMLQGASSEEREVLAAIPYQRNTAMLHTDIRLLPQRKRAWASWNYHAAFAAGHGASNPVSLTYLLNRLQPLPFKSPVMVTMNPLIEIDPAKLIKTIKYDHPVFLPSSVPAKKALRALQGHNRTWYAGAWSRYGFHEDGLMSGIAVAKALGATVPWETNVPAANDLAHAYPGVDA